MSTPRNRGVNGPREARAERPVKCQSANDAERTRSELVPSKLDVLKSADRNEAPGWRL
jgi:hypothetical protein